MTLQLPGYVTAERVAALGTQLNNVALSMSTINQNPLAKYPALAKWSHLGIVNREGVLNLLDKISPKD